MSNGSERRPTPDNPLVLEERRAAWIGPSVILRGEIVSSEDLTIDGRFEGTIRVSHALTIGESAEIKADLVAKTITIHGSVVGDITASERLDLRASGSVEGNVRARRFTMADGAVLRGKLESGGLLEARPGS